LTIAAFFFMPRSRISSPVKIKLADAVSEGDRGQARLSILTAWDLPQIVHGFMTRGGGVSQGPYESLNLAEWVGDDAEAVRRNWDTWRSSYPGTRVAYLQQVHGNHVHTLDGNHDGTRAIGDGIVTAAPGLVVGVFTADCVPVLLVDTECRIVGALHAGWRGTLANIADAGVRAMSALGGSPDRIRADLGPSIGICCFEVDAELAHRFIQQIPGALTCSRPGRAGKKYLNLRGIIRQQLRAAGISSESISDVGPCTRCANDQFFSRRAATGAATGLQMSFIGLPTGNHDAAQSP
jgi:YfiH family protein